MKRKKPKMEKKLPNPVTVKVLSNTNNASPSYSPPPQSIKLPQTATPMKDMSQTVIETDDYACIPIKSVSIPPLKHRGKKV